MANQIIVRGLVMRDITDPSLIILITDGWAQHWGLPEWARPYIGKRMVISLEEKEQEISHNLEAVLEGP